MYTQVRNVSIKCRTEQLMDHIQYHTAVRGMDFMLRDEGPHPCIFGEGQIQVGVEARRIVQHLMIKDKRKEREALAHPGSSQPDLDPTS